MLKLSTVTVAALVLAGCAAAPPLSGPGAQVRQITSAQAQSCKFLRIVEFSDSYFFNFGKDSTVMNAIGENNLRNAVGAVGANAFVLTKSDSGWFVGHVAYAGEAYKCSR